jgi:nitroreductase
MNETMQTILTRRSIRAFKPDMLPRETIDAIIEAGIGDDDMEMRRKKQAAYI